MKTVRESGGMEVNDAPTGVGKLLLQKLRERLGKT